VTLSTGGVDGDIGYYYPTPDGLFTNIVTADLLLSYVLPDNQPDFLRAVFRSLSGERERSAKGRSERREDEGMTTGMREVDMVLGHVAGSSSSTWPYVLSVPLREVMVASAWFDEHLRTLHLSLVSALSPTPSSTVDRPSHGHLLTYSDVLIANVPPSGIVSISRNGSPFLAYSPLPRDGLWLLTVPTPPPSQMSSDVYLISL
jgi:hypothetical protein